MGSVNIMGNTDTLKIVRGKEKIKYVSSQARLRLSYPRIC